MFQKAFFMLIGLSIAFSLKSQNIPTTQTTPSATTQTLNPIPSAYNSNIPLNYIRTWEAGMPISTEASIYASTHTLQEVKQTTQYFDGLGRPIQAVAKKASPNGFDIVSPSIYDDYGRETIKYLPYVSPGTDGKFKLDPFNEQNNFMKGYYNPGNDANGEKFFYSKAHFEASPLNRNDTTYSQGNSWVGTGIGISQQFMVNTAADSVLFWNIDTTKGVTPTSTYYSSAQLYKTISTDERGFKTVEFKDRDGRVVLKKTQLLSSPSNGHFGWLCTYYVYDNYGNLRFVMQPKATEWLRVNNWIFDAGTYISSAIAKGLCFSYEYDIKNRMVIKRVPGAGEVWIVYDKRNRPIMTQDSLMRLSGKWLYTNYDSLNRTVVSALWTITGNRVYHQGLADTSIIYPKPTTNVEVLTQLYYDNYDWVSLSGSGLSNALISTNPSNFYTASNTTFPYPQSITSFIVTTGLKTGMRTKVLGTSNTYLYSVSFYDDHGRVIQSHSTNISGAKDTTTMQYAFNGAVLRTLIGHGKGGANTLNYSVFTKTFYDAGSRRVAITKIIGNSQEDTLTSNKYDELGQLSLKKIGLTRTGLTNFAYTSNPLDSLRYLYNVRGWLRGINKDFSNNSNGASNWFGMELNYDYGFTQGQLNGNIAGIKWRNNGDGAQRGYGFNYDAVNRLTKADFTQYTGNNWSNAGAGIDFSVSNLNYDYNGNILSMTQKGLNLSKSLIIDSLAYGYNSNSNQLNYVTDLANDTTAHLGDFTEINNNTSQDFIYDGNGSLTVDNNKKVNTIHYNYLNLPDSISITGKGYIKYIYDASGNKHKKITSETSINKITTTTYLGGFVYQYAATTTNPNGLDTLQFVLHEEGRARPKTVAKSDTMLYDFLERDHLGNTRVVLTDEMLQDVYPAATLENNASAFATENSYYSINTFDTVPVTSIASWGATAGKNYVNNNGNPPVNNNPYSNTTAVSSYVYKLNGSTGDKTGLGVTLKVMSGDVVNIFGKSFWHNNTGSNPVNNYLINSAINSFIAAFAGTKMLLNMHGPTAAALQAAPSTPAGLNSWLGSVPNPNQAAVPRAYINWILFNEQFVPVASNCGYNQVSGNPDSVKPHSSVVQINTNGYLYVYCSNESNVDVFFDNLQVIQTRGPLLETSNYYPFGLAMAGISSKAATTLENKYKYNGKELQSKEFSDGSGLELYDFGAREQDPQIGRWTTIDPLAQKRYWATPYNYVQNNPLNRIDPNGLTDYTLDKKTGDVKQVGEKNDDPDRIVQTDRKGNVKKKGEGFLGGLVRKSERGKAKVAIDGIEKGILSNGQNFQNKDQVISVGGEGQPSVAGVKSFTLQLSEYVGKEIKGFSYSSDGSGNATDIVLGGYKNNLVDKSYGTTTELRNKYGDRFSLNNLLQDFHTHPNGQLGATQSNPELSQDVKSLQNDRPFMPNASFIILYRVAGQATPAEYDYTHEYIPPQK
jgi:RHS repeat-associated protein